MDSGEKSSFQILFLARNMSMFRVGKPLPYMILPLHIHTQEPHLITSYTNRY